MNTSFFADKISIFNVLIASDITMVDKILNLKAVFAMYPNCLISRSISSHFDITIGHFLAKWIKRM